MTDTGLHERRPAELQPWNVLAIAAFVLAFVAPPGGIVYGHIARRQLRLSGEQGDGLALAGLILGSVLTAAIVLFVLVWIAVLIATVVGVVSQIPDVRS